MEPILVVKGVSKYFGKLKALDEVSLEVPRGKVTLLIGPNGSGKTTLINVVSGVLSPDRGSVIFEGKDITRLSPHERFKLGIVRSFQIPRLFQNLSVMENAIIGRDGNPGESVVYGLLKSLWVEFEKRAFLDALGKLEFMRLKGLSERRPGELSGGQMKLLELSRTLMPLNPKLVLIDEPIAGVNPALAHEIFSIIKGATVKLGVTFLIVEHRLDVAVEYADYAYAMHLGKVIAEGEPHKVLENPKVIESYLGA